MSSFFGKLRGNGANSNSANAVTATKKDIPPVPLTPLQKLLTDAGPLKSDGSDKFFGMENAPFANTCYCNSILQCLYYSAPFRESVINYPQRSPPESLETALSTNFKYPDPDISLEDALLQTKLKQQQNANNVANRPPVLPQNQIPKPEDKDSPEYKKKVAMHTLPVLETTDNSQNYGMQESLFTSLKDIFESIAASQERMGVVRPQHFLDVLRRENEMFRTAMHQDAHEFLNLLLNEVVSNVEAEAKRTPVLGDGDSESSTPTSASVATTLATSVGAKSPYNTRWVHELFEGKLTSETECLTCEKKSQRDEVFLDLSVDLEQHSSVTSCLRKFSEEEMLCERNKFHCDNCGGLQEAEKRMKIKRLPRILALHLKRFKYTEDLQRLQKLFHRVVYPYYLRLFNTTDDAEDPDRLYELYAVVVHIGGGPYHGHYVAIIKTEDRGWLLFDDEMVEPVDKSYVRNFFGDRPGQACAYVLFYQETTFEAMQRELQSEHMAAKGENPDLATTASLNMNGSTAPVDISRVRSAVPQLPVTDSSPSTSFNAIKQVPSAPQLSTMADPSSPSALPPATATAQSPTTPMSSSPNKLPISMPRIPLMSRTPDRAAEVQSKKERAREEKDRKAQEREKEKEEKQKRKELEKAGARQRELAKKEEQLVKSALEASRLTAKEEKKRVSSEKRLSAEGVGGKVVGNGNDSRNGREKENGNVHGNVNGNGNGHGIAGGFANGINGIAGGLGKLKLGGRSLSYSRKHKENRDKEKEKVPDLPAPISTLNGYYTPSDTTMSTNGPPPALPLASYSTDTSSTPVTDVEQQSVPRQHQQLASRVSEQLDQYESSPQSLTSLPQAPPLPPSPKQPTARRSRFSLRKKSFSVL
ncbi:hypothetical protein FQN49_003592 [Arthroderma sp. PD_2]|nr:hypothetical protein FQN49_003592 [Arthroderma sp. PD_2]